MFLIYFFIRYTLFNSTTRVGELPMRTRFTNLVWSSVGYESVMNDHYTLQLPLVEEFRDLFLSTYQVCNTKSTCYIVNSSC